MKRFLALVLASLTLLTATGCASFLNRSYTEVSPHSASYYEKTDKSVLRAELTMFSSAAKPRSAS